MIFHLSVAAHDPRHVADVLAEIWKGEVFRFGPVEGAWMVLVDDGRGSAIEVYPIDAVLREVPGDADARDERTGAAAYTATHAAIATELDRESVLAIARREGWPAKYRKRGGIFGLVELWIEGRQLFEILTPDMQTEYLAVMTRERWRGMGKYKRE
jgi:hypothetical protein